MSHPPPLSEMMAVKGLAPCLTTSSLPRFPPPLADILRPGIISPAVYTHAVPALPSSSCVPGESLAHPAAPFLRPCLGAVGGWRTTAW